MSLPLVSICIPVKNAETTIAKTIKSLLNQTYSHIEIVVVDNASTDATVEITESFKSSKIKIIQRSTDIGCDKNILTCHEFGNGKYTCVFHADDVYESTIIEKSIAILEKNPDVGIVFSLANFINQNDHHIGQSKSFSQLKIKNDSVTYFSFQALFQKILLLNNFLITPSAVVRTELYQSIGSFRDDEITSSLDLDTWLRITQHTKLALINERLINYRRSSMNGSTLINKGRTELADFFKVIDRWLLTPHVLKFLTKADHENYNELKRRDLIVCAAKAVLQGDPIKSKNLILQEANKYQKNAFKTLNGIKYTFVKKLIELHTIVPKNFKNKICLFLHKAIVNK